MCVPELSDEHETFRRGTALVVSLVKSAEDGCFARVVSGEDGAGVVVAQPSVGRGRRKDRENGKESEHVWREVNTI